MSTNGPYLTNTVVGITATASNGWTFLQWLGDASGTNPATTVNMTRNKSVRALFGTTLSTTAAGNGLISKDPISGLYPYGTVVRLTAIPQPGSYFGIWGDAASGNTNPLDFVVNTPNRTVSALFSALTNGQFALNLSTVGLGKVAANPRANSYGNGQLITLTATPNSNQVFTGWSGDASGTQNPLSVTMNQSRYITANFTKKPSLTLQLFPSTFATEGFQLVLTGAFGEIYSLEASANLIDWSAITALTNTYGTVQFTEFPSTNSNQQFYRAAQP